jgi:hypothetical protein
MKKRKLRVGEKEKRIATTRRQKPEGVATPGVFYPASSCSDATFQNGQRSADERVSPEGKPKALMQGSEIPLLL